MWIKLKTENKYVHVMKVTDLVTRNSDQLNLHFSDFSTNLYRFYKFTALENKKEKVLFLHRGPWKNLFPRR